MEFIITSQKTCNFSLYRWRRPRIYKQRYWGWHYSNHL